MITPSLEEIRNIAATGTYRCAPICTEILSDIRTPIEVLRILKSVSKHCYLLESVTEHEKWGRYTFLGYDPKSAITCRNGKIKIGEVTIETNDPQQYIRQVLAEHKSPTIPGLPPFTGGLVGYFAYDWLKYAEPSLKFSAQDTEGFNDADLMLFDKVIAFDNFRQKIMLIANIKLDDLETEYNRAALELKHLEELIRFGTFAVAAGNTAQAAGTVVGAVAGIAGTAQTAGTERTSVASVRTSGRLLSEPRPLFNKEQYCEMVEKAKHHIVEGDIFQIVLSNRLEADFEGSLLDTYRVLRTVNPSPYMFYFSGDNLEAAGASPETLVKLQDGVLHTFPLAGTRPRGKTEEEDKALEKELLADPKELAEHSMLVDLGRNDLGKISKFGTVEVESSFDVLRYSHVMHIGSTVRGEIRDDLDAMDAIGAVLPAGTLSGAPKIMACKLIDELEDNKRGIYGGAFGYVSFTGNMDTCIGIRLAYAKNGKVFVRSGAGIVADSVPEKEHQECINKAAAVMKALEMAQGLEGDSMAGGLMSGTTQRQDSTSARPAER